MTTSLTTQKPITEGWKSLKAAGFENVTTIVPNATNHGTSRGMNMCISISSSGALWKWFLRLRFEAHIRPAALFGLALVPDCPGGLYSWFLFHRTSVPMIFVVLSVDRKHWKHDRNDIPKSPIGWNSSDRLCKSGRQVTQTKSQEFNIQFSLCRQRWGNAKPIPILSMTPPAFASRVEPG